MRPPDVNLTETPEATVRRYAKQVIELENRLRERDKFKEALKTILRDQLGVR